MKSLEEERRKALTVVDALTFRLSAKEGKLYERTLELYMLAEMLLSAASKEEQSKAMSLLSGWWIGIGAYSKNMEIRRG